MAPSSTQKPCVCPGQSGDDHRSVRLGPPSSIARSPDGKSGRLAVEGTAREAHGAIDHSLDGRRVAIICMGDFHFRTRVAEIVTGSAQRSWSKNWCALVESFTYEFYLAMMRLGKR